VEIAEILACPACANRSARDFRVGETRLRRCRRCRLVYARETADPAYIYDDSYLTAASPFGPDTTSPMYGAIARFVAAQRFEILERSVPIGSVLDVGCGSGEALDVAVGRGWRGVGVEPVPASAERARSLGLDVRCGRLGLVDVPPHSFDVVAAWHVLEHMAEPVSFLDSLANFVKPGGLVAIEVPNWSCPTRRTRGEEWELLCPLEHVVHYTPRTLRRTIRRAGMSAKVRTETYLNSNRLVDRLGRGGAVFAVAAV
jgi:2-polyprenyl-3-methyl-5-hydroxy-6-metoxy-1,4-benzoquinol methylase